LWLCEQVLALGKSVLALIWDNASQAGWVSRSEPGCVSTIRPCYTRRKRGKWVCVSSHVGSPSRVLGWTALSQSGSRAREPLSSLLDCWPRRRVKQRVC